MACTHRISTGIVRGIPRLWPLPLPSKLLCLSRTALIPKRGSIEATTFVLSMLEGSRHKRVQLQFNRALAGASPEAIAATLQMATNPAVVDAFALAANADGERPV